MGQYQHRRDRRSAATESAPAPSATEYRAPTVVLEEQVFTIGSIKDAAKSELVKRNWVEKCLPSSSFTNSNLAASFVLPIVKTWYSNTTVGARYSVVLGAGAGSVAAGRLAWRC